MAADDFALIVENLGKVDLLDMEATVADAKPTLHVIDEREGRYGEPGTIIVIMLVGSLALPPVLLWLARHRKGFKYTEQNEVTLPNGTKVKSLVKVSATESGPPSPAVLQQLRKFPGVDPTKLSEAYAQSTSGDTSDPQG